MRIFLEYSILMSPEPPAASPQKNDNPMGIKLFYFNAFYLDRPKSEGAFSESCSIFLDRSVTKGRSRELQNGKRVCTIMKTNMVE